MKKGLCVGSDFVFLLHSYRERHRHFTFSVEASYRVFDYDIDINLLFSIQGLDTAPSTHNQ